MNIIFQRDDERQLKMTPLSLVFYFFLNFKTLKFSQKKQ